MAGPLPGRMNARNVVEQAIGEKLDGFSLDDPNTGKEPGRLNATPVERRPTWSEACNGGPGCLHPRNDLARRVRRQVLDELQWGRDVSIPEIPLAPGPWP